MTTDLTPWMIDKVRALLRYADGLGIDAEVVSTRRSCAEQNDIYDHGAGVTTNARGCQSWHVWGRAVDLLVHGPAEGYRELGDWWKAEGGVWGGDFPIGDFGHFEWHPGVHISDICPTGAECPDPTMAWPEDRPFFARPVVMAVIGAALAGGGILLSRRLLSR
jgi:hypothetical protein